VFLVVSGSILKPYLAKDLCTVWYRAQ
jgi:hypothetical protein